MPKRTESLASTSRYLHVYNRGVDHGRIFFTENDYCLFLSYAQDFLEEAGINLYLYALIPNHFHLVLRQAEPFAASLYMKRLTETFARAINKKRSRSGHLFQGRFGVRDADDDAGLLRMSYYVHMNPVLAQLSPAPEDWLFSSCRKYLSGEESSLVSTKTLLSLVGGVEGYTKFLRGFDPTDPDSARSFIVAPGGKIG